MNMRWMPPSHQPANDVRRRGGAAVFWLTGLVLVAALLFGGASRLNLIQVSALELLSLPLLAVAVWRLTLDGDWRAIAAPAAILAAAAAVPLLQLIPIPFALWAELPGHAAPAEGLRLAGLGGGWRPLSLAPIETLRHMLALLPPAAVFLGACTLRQGERRWLAGFIPAAAALSLLIGLAQISGGPGSPLYFYEITNDNYAVGLFANRNHQAALLVVSLPFAALWIDFTRRDRRRTLVSVAVALSIFLIEIVGLITVQSRAGVLLLAPSLLASAFLVWRVGGGRVERRAAMVFGVVVLVVLAAALILGAGPLMERFGNPGDSRLTTAPIVATAAWAHLPFGAGVGSFPQVYASVEPIETMGRTFWNHAHNDYLELWLDAGWLGAAVLLAFLAWWGMRALAAWRGDGPEQRLARAASVATGLLLVHSMADYPLRTLGLACVFAFACALMAARPKAVSAAR